MILSHRHGLSRLAPAIAILVLVLVTWLFASGPRPSAPRPGIGGTDQAPYVEGEVLIRFKDPAVESTRRSIRSTLGAQKVRRLGRSLELLRLQGGRTTVDAIERFRRHPDVEYVEPNYLVRLDTLPDDLRFPELYGLRNTGQTGGTPDADIDADLAWDLTTGTHDVVVGVIDSGIDYRHPDLAANIWTNPGETPDNGIDDDGNGYVDDVHGWDFVNGDNDPFDDNGHGTHVAGTIGAVGDNDLGVTGVAWKVTLVPLKFVARDGFGTTADAVEAIRYATSIGANITNNSWGGGAYSQAMLDAIVTAAEADVLFVASAGNDGFNNDLFPHYPSSYDAPNVVAVTTLNHMDARPILSNLGARSVDLGAPGVAILSTYTGGAYAFLSGSSMAAPHVSGAAALIRTLAPHIGVVELKQLLLDNVDPVPGLAGITVTGGRVNAFRSLSDRDVIDPAAIDDLATGAATSGSIVLTWTAVGDDGYEGSASAYDLRHAPWPLDEATFPLATRVWDTPPARPVGSVEAIEVTGLDAGTLHYFAIRALDEWGNAGPISNVASATTLPAPTLASSPSSFDVELFAGQATTRTLTVANIGVGTLDWSVGTPDGATWLGLSPTSGRILAGESRELVLAVDSRGLAPGTRTVTIELLSNDPLRPVVDHPLTLDLTSAPAIEIAPTAIDFGEVFVGGSATATLEIGNFGTELLAVDASNWSDGAIAVVPSSVSVPAGESRSLEVTFAPTAPGVLDDLLLVTSNAPNAPSIGVTLGGYAAPPPGIDIAPTAIDETVLAGTTLTRILRIHNPGASPLEAAFFFEPGANPGTALSSPLVNGGFETGDFTGWQATQNDVVGLVPWTVTEAGGGWFDNSIPIEGSFSALNGFEGGGGLRYDLVQLLDIPAGVTHAQLTYADRIQWDDMGAATILSRTYEGTIEDTDETILDVIVREEILFDGSGYHDLGWRWRTADLTPFAGQTVRLHMREYVRQGLTGPAQLEFDAFRIDIGGFPDWFRPDPKRITVPPGEHVDVEVILDASGLLADDLDAFIRVETNVPSTPRVLVPIRLSVFGLPAIEVDGEPVVLESSADFATDGARTEHAFSLPLPPEAEGTIELTLIGDFGDPGEGATLYAEGQGLGAAGNLGQDCTSATASFALSAEALATFAADGTVGLSVQNTPSVGPVCNVNRHSLRLTYEAPSWQLDFGSVYLGSADTRSLTITNRGTAPLEVGPVTSDRRDFTPSFDFVTLGIGESNRLEVVFVPGMDGTTSGTMLLPSNDPAAPVIEIDLLGVGVVPPTTVVDPESIDLRLPVGGMRTESLLVSNGGGESLEFSTTVTSAPASFVKVEPVAGEILPGASAALDVFIDTRGLAPGTYFASIEIGGTNPATSAVTVPVELVVDQAPDLVVHGRALTVTSGADFSGDGATTTHVFPVDAVPAGGGTLRLIAIGDFGEPDEIATVSAEGRVLGAAGGFGRDCAAALTEIELDAAMVAALAADGMIEADVRNSANVGDDCLANSHTLRLTYDESVEPLDFGSLFVGSGAERPLVIDNAGTLPLEVASIVSTSPAFSIAGGPFTVAPDESHTVIVRFDPPSEAVFEGLLEMSSNDPDEPVASVTLVGAGAEPPVIEVDPTSLVLSLDSGTSETVPLAIGNLGRGALELGVSVEPALASFVSILNAPDQVPAGATSTIELEIDASLLDDGAYDAVVVLATNDPLSPRVEVPLAIEVTGVPRISLSTDRLDFGETLVGADKELWVEIANVGTAPLEIEGADTDHADFSSEIDTPILAPRATTSMRVGFRPSDDGTVSASLELTSNDPLRPQHPVPLSGSGVAPPVIAVTPGGLGASIESGSTDTRALSVRNTGSSPLEFEVLVRPQAVPREATRGEPPPVTLEAIAATPESLACLIGDPMHRQLYGQSRGGTGFHRYDASSDSWTNLADAPHAAGAGCGAAWLDGKIYTSYADASNLGVYDPTTDAWRTVAAPLADTAILASDGKRFLYQIRGTVGRRFDPASGTIDPIASPPFTFDPRGGLRNLDELLLGHQGGQGVQFAAYETTTDRWTALPSLPGVAGAGSASDPVHRTFTVQGSPGTGELYSFSVDEATWQTVSVLPHTVDGGGLAWLPDPFAGIYVAGGGSAELRWVTEPAFVTVAPHTGSVVPGGSVELQTTFDASRLYAGSYRADVRISSNDVASPRRTIPAELTVTGVPRMSIATVQLDFGEVFVGIAYDLPLIIENTGTERLEIASISSDLAQVVAVPSAVPVAPGASETVTIRLTPIDAGAIEGTLTISGNDPTTPTFDVAVVAFGVHAPRVEISPTNLETALADGDRQTRTLALRNAGRVPLLFSLDVIPSDATFVRPTVTSGELPPGESVDLDVVFDATSVPLGTQPAEIRMTTNDPLLPLAVIPSSLTVLGVPRVALGGTQVLLESTATFVRSGASTLHTFSGVMPPSGSGTLLLSAEGDYGDPGETATAVAEGYTLGQVGGGVPDCGIAEGEFAVDAAQLTSISQDGTIEIEVQNTTQVRAFCPANRHTVRLSYFGSAERLEFGTVFFGTSRELPLVVENLGNATLEVGPISSNAAEFGAAIPTARVEPGASEKITISFTPSAVDDFAGILTLPSNDPSTPQIQINLVGRGERAPQLVVDPPSLEIPVAEGSRTTRPLSLLNQGAGPLDYSLSVPPPEATFIRLSALGGELAPQEDTTIEVEVDVAGLPPGAIESWIEVVSNDPDQPVILVPVTVSVSSGPDISFVGERVVLESVVEFDSSGALTRHELPVVIPPAGEGRFEVVGDGDFGASSEWAIITAEGGRPIGTIGGVGTDCVPTFGIFPIDADTVAALVDDNVVGVEVQNTANVDPLCPANAHTVRLSYNAQRDSLDYGTVFVGQTGLRSTTLLNHGSETLEVHRIATNRSEFSPSTTSLSLAPGQSENVTVAFSPIVGSGAVEGTLTVESNDPDTPALTIPLTGSGADPPLLGLSDSSIDATLPEGAREMRPLTVTNSGASPLSLSVELLPAEDFRGDYTLFGTDGPDANLYVIDPVTGDVTFIGVMGVSAPSLAVDPTSGVMYVGQGGGTAALYTVDPTTGSVSFVGYTGFGALSAMDFDANGTLYAAVNSIDGPGTGGDSLAIIDNKTGQAKVIGPFGAGIGTAGGLPGIAGLAFHPTTGALYAASADHAATDGSPSLYLIDPITGEATLIGPVVDAQGDPVPGGVGSLQFDPDGVLLGGTGRGTGNLIRIEPGTGRYTLIGHAVPAALGGLALRQNPPDLSFLAVSPTSATVAPFDALELQVTLDARALPPGRLVARIAIENNDPDRPFVEIPVDLTVVGVPDIAIPGERVRLESSEEFEGTGNLTFHGLDVSTPAAGGAVIELIADGDFGDVSEVARLWVDGLKLGTVGATGSDCFPATGTFALAANDFAGLAADGVLDIEVANSPTVFSFCVVNRHTLRLSYDLPLEQLDFGIVYVGYERSLPLVIKNDGRAELDLSSIVTDDPAVTLAADVATVPPFGEVTIPVRFAPDRVGPLSASVRIDSNDPDEPSFTIDLRGTALGAPVAEVDPHAVKAALPPWDASTLTKIVRLHNAGHSDLVWSADLYESFAVERSGGPDSFGYRYEDSDEPGGPVFEWVDIDQTGESVPLDDDDANSGPIPLPFDFPFYGTDFGFVFVSADGWLSFTSEKSSYSNPASLPDSGFSVPENLVAPFWDDLNLGNGRVTYHDDGTRFIVQYTSVDRFASAANLTFQVILYPSGKIVFQYLSMVGTLDSATIGMQNADRTVGLLVAYNEPYVHDELAVEFTPIARWVSAAPLAGIIPPGDIGEILLTFDATDVADGDHTAQLLVRSNDPAQAEITVPVGLNVGVVELEQFEIFPETINLSSRGRMIRASIQLPPVYDPRDVVAGTVALYGEVFAEPGSIEIADENGDGIDEAIMRFDRQVFSRLVPLEGDLVPVTITGEVDGQTWFHGVTEVRIRRRVEGR